ncbi:unnamed protein product [Gongylonema pulchrum]|uniref:Uncharacterized protein n=1 Tax=Gongylonema pulchrum TaxID=637853 RepID=A0A183D0X7_9BILA|nr:unnamed protein product [Gongylonema pulchrum]
MKTAVFGHDEICDDTSLSLNSGAVPPLTFTPPATLSVSASLPIRRSGCSVVNAVGSYRPHHPRRTSRMQNVSLYPSGKHRAFLITCFFRPLFLRRSHFCCFFVL